MRQHGMNLGYWLTEIKLKPKEGTQNTLDKVKLVESLTVPMSVTDAYLPLSNLTWAFMEELIEVRKEIELTVWSVVPMSITQGIVTQ